MDDVEQRQLVVSFLRSETETSTAALEKRVEPVREFLERGKDSLSIESFELESILVHRSGGRGTRPRDHGDGVLHEAPFAEAIFSVKFRRQGSAENGNAVKSQVPYLYKKWCESPPILDAWLSSGSDQHLFEVFQASKFGNERLEIKQISFGIIINLTRFCPEDIIDCTKLLPDDLTVPAVSVQAFFNHIHRHLKIFLAQTHTCDNYRGVKSWFILEIEYSSIARVIVDTRAHYTDLYLRLTHPALLHGSQLCETVTNNKPQNFRNFNRYNTLGCTASNCSLKINARRLGGSNTVKLRWKNWSGLLQTLNTLFSKLIRSECFVASMVTIEKPKAGIRRVADLLKEFFDDDSIAFRAKYAIEACKLISFDFTRQLAVQPIKEVSAFFNALKRLTTHKGTHKLFEKTMFHLLEAVDEGNVIVYKDGLLSQFRKFETQERERQVRAQDTEDEDEVPQGMAIVYKVFLTPSRTILRPPKEHGENRVLRQVDRDYVLRVAFRDDDLCSLTHSLREPYGRSFLDSFLKSFLRVGVVLANRTYEYLAASSSQLREHGCWFYAEDEQGRTSQSIRQEMGSFDTIENVGKKMAREGQCFSSTIETVRVSEDEFITIKDIKGGEHKVSKKPYIFSDGIGKISAKLRDDVCEALKDTLKGKKPSAFQIRYRGAKGMVALDPTLQGRCLVLRESMVKFECPSASSSSFEVIKYSEERSTTLNKQVITILEQLGVSASVFLRYQKANIIDFTDALIFENVACGRLMASIKKDPDCFIDFYKFREFGMSVINDPYFRSALIVLFKNIIKNLRSKTRIAIPWNLGRNMLGVMDETARLEYGQVYIRYTVKEDVCGPDTLERVDKESGDTPTDLEHDSASPAELLTEVVKQKVVVSKCPCVHPGDVRMFQAVDIPELAHLVDVIVFPQKGPRPHPNEMAGSDLDGDEYIVIWDPQFYFKCQCNECKKNPQSDGNHQPMTFDDSPPEKKENITIEDCYDFICDFIMNDHKGQISNAHLAHADREVDGIFSKKCLKLAKTTSICLDFAKTGRLAKLRSEERVKIYPDFMEKQDHKPSYCSTRVLGQLYRACRFLENTVSLRSAERREKYVNRKFELPGWVTMKEQAINFIKKYEDRLIKIMNHMGIKSEAEIMVSLVNNISKYQSKSFHDIEELQEQLERQRAFLNKKMKELFSKLSGGNPDRPFLLASACYMMVYDPPDGQAITPFYGAPWILFEYLIDCSEINEDEGQEVPNCPLASAITEAIEQKFDAGLKRSEKIMLVLIDWAEAEGLLGENKKMFICHRCLYSIFRHSRESVHEEEIECSVGARVLLFIRFCAIEFESKIQLLDFSTCKVECSMPQKEQSFFQRITMAAMGTYSSLAVSGDICAIKGLSCGKPHKVQTTWTARLCFPLVLDIRGAESLSFLADHKEAIARILKEWCDADEEDRIALNFEDSKGNRQVEVIIEAREWTRYTLEKLLYDFDNENVLIDKLRTAVIKRGEYIR